MKTIGVICGGVVAGAAILLAGTGRRPTGLRDRPVQVVAAAPAGGAVVPEPVRTAPRRDDAPPAGPSLKAGIGARDDARVMLGMLAAQARTEQRDGAWADRSEAQLRPLLARIMPYGALPAAVECGETLCTIVGSLPESFGAGEVSALLQALQGKEMRAALPDSNLVGGPAVTAQSRGGSRYALFFKRAEP